MGASKRANNPTVYAKLMDHNLARPLEETSELLAGFFDHPRDRLLEEIETRLMHAYAEGVRDGFAQGIAVASQETALS